MNDNKTFVVTGSNLFGQWFSWSKNKGTFPKFETVIIDDEDSINFDLTQANLIATCWSYNIFKICDVFYVSGSWWGKDNQLIKLPIFEEYLQSCRQSKVLVTGNDYMIILIEVEKRSVCFFYFETQNFEKVVFTEEPIIENAKKPRTSDDIIKVLATNNIFIYLSSEGNVYTGQLPSYLDTQHCLGKVCNIECGYEHYMLLTDEGRVYTWGNGRRLQLGHGDLTNLDLPTEVEGLAGIKIVKIGAGGWHSLALSDCGDLYVWGWNDTGQLGMESKSGQENKGLKNYTLPTLVDLYDENDELVELCIKDIACGTRHTAILLEDNTVWTAGCNKYGQLGVSPKKHEKIECFQKVFYNDDISKISCAPWNTIIEIERKKEFC